jgi:penicillin G amidase
MSVKTDARSRWLRRLFIGCAVLLLVMGMTLWALLRGSLAHLDGELRLPGLTGAVTVQRDLLGVPTVSAGNRTDLAFATGFLHAQERFFQMDLLRRSAGGELAQLIGPSALPTDEAHRLHRFRARAEAQLKTLPPEEVQLLERYAAGVNEGLAKLSVRPFEYFVLRSRPEVWVPVDSLLVAWAMYFELQGGLESRESARGWLRDHASLEQLAMLLPERTFYDAAADEQSPAAPVPLPALPPDWFAKPAANAVATIEVAAHVGSNNWALAGQRAGRESSIVATDMHLAIGLPNTWYRAKFTYPDGTGKQLTILGITLPGSPVMIAGSNGNVAWGFTNSYSDSLDLVELRADPSDPFRFKTANGWETVVEHRESIKVRGTAPVAMKVLESSIGPIRQIQQRFYAVHWVAHEPGAVNLGLLGMERVEDVAGARAVANRSGIPAQNMLAGDKQGHIGWTIAGALLGRDAQLATTFPYAADAGFHRMGLRPPTDYPHVVNPRGGQLWTANNLQRGDQAERKIGDGGADVGARALQIGARLKEMQRVDEAAVYRIGLDDRAEFMTAWRDRAVKALDSGALAGNPARTEFRRLLTEHWTGHAGVDSVGYRLARSYLYSTYIELFGGVDEELQKLSKEATFGNANPRWPVVAARLLDEKPKGWLPRGRSWRDLELAAIDRVIDRLTRGGQPLSKATWGARNTARIGHPFATSLPVLGAALAAPADPLAGDEHMPRISAPSFGQSERMVISPGRESEAIFNMPGGQSGHPLSPFFLAGHEAWVKGDPTLLAPGPTAFTLKLVVK